MSNCQFVWITAGPVLQMGPACASCEALQFGSGMPYLPNSREGSNIHYELYKLCKADIIHTDINTYKQKDPCIPRDPLAQEVFHHQHMKQMSYPALT